MIDLSRIRAIACTLATAIALSAVFSLAFPAAPAAAEPYSIQIGALRNPDASFVAAAEQIGTVYTSETRDGLTRFQVGRYATKAQAEEALNAIRRAGYKTAFVVDKRSASAASVAAAARRQPLPSVSSGPPPAATTAAQAPRRGSALDGVPASLRERVVLLDGRLHVMEDGSFIPLSEYPIPSE